MSFRQTPVSDECAKLDNGQLRMVAMEIKIINRFAAPARVKVSNHLRLLMSAAGENYSQKRSWLDKWHEVQTMLHIEIVERFIQSKI